MKIFKLTPTGVGDGDWERSSYKGEAVIRAESEDQARAIASVRFAMAKNTRPGQIITFPPWRNSTSVACTILSSSENSTSGPAALLMPKEWA